MHRPGRSRTIGLFVSVSRFGPVSYTHLDVYKRQVSISVRPERYSHHLIKESGQFAINLPTEQLVRAVDWCGVKSGRDNDKFAACKLHAAPGSVLTDCPILEESPVNLECRVTQVIPLGSHDLFLAEVVACDVDESLLDENGKLCLDKAKLIVYSHGEYLLSLIHI